MMCCGAILFAGCILLLVLWLIRKNKPINMELLVDKVVVITGASSGLGEACAVAFCRAGCKVVLCARRLNELVRVQQILKNMEGAKHEPQIVVMDIEDFDSLPHRVDEIISHQGHIDILINNAGISYRGDIINTALHVFSKVMMVNYTAQVAVTKAILPQMLAQKSGHIVTISSVQGKIAIPYRSAYAASKHAIQAFSDCLRSELATDNIQVTVINPGYIQTNLSLNAITSSGTTYGVTDSTTAQGMSPSDVAKQVLHALCTNTNELILSQLSHKIAVYLRNVLPNVFFSIMKSRAKKQKKDYIKND